MKRAAIVIAMLGMCAWSLGQDKPAAQSAPTAQAPPAAQGKRPPKVNSQEEYAAFKEATAVTDPAAAEKAANDFATKYPESELRPLVYKAVMQRYQQANNGDKLVEMAKKALEVDPDDPEALVGVAQVLVERTRDTDLDRDQRLDESRKDAERALITIDTDVPTSGYPPEQLNSYKSYLRSEAYAVLGTLAFNAKKWPDAESNLRKSIDAMPQQPDVVVVYRLAVSLDMQNRVPDALKVVQQAVDLTKDRADSAVGKAARQEQDRLTKLNSGSAPGQSALPQKN